MSLTSLKRGVNENYSLPPSVLLTAFCSLPTDYSSVVTCIFTPRIRSQSIKTISPVSAGER